MLSKVCFNPRICKRCDVWTTSSNSTKLVSIHASVKDATLLEVAITLLTCVSIHASVKDATKTPLLYSFLVLCFNPRICKRCDFHLYVIVQNNASFNPRICKRCDLSMLDHGDLCPCFNPRICKRCDLHLFLLHLHIIPFQSTHL